MREYEVTVIFQPKLDDESRTELVDRVTSWLAPDAEGEENQPKINLWGDRKLAYPIRDFNQGYYVHYEVNLDPADIKEIERKLQFVEDVLRYLIVRKED